MESILSHLQSLVDYAVPMIVLLGLLIFVHELGHFLVAKFYKVRVEVFSLGFGPKILKFKRGETVYALSLVPFGGYVKMFGDDPTAEIDESLKAVSLNHKPVMHRIAIVLAGPLMNLFFALAVFTVVSLIGEQVAAPQLGDIDEKSPAYAQGLRSGDRVLAIDGEPILAWDELQKAIERHPEKALSLAIQRNGKGPDVLESVTITPKQVANKSPLSWDQSIGEVEGVTMSARSTFIGIRDPESAMGRAGFKTGDHIKSVNGVALTKWRELLATIEAQKATGRLEFEAERGMLDEKTSDHPEQIKGSVQIPSDAVAKSAEEVLASVGAEFPQLYLAATEKGAAEKAGLKEGDRLISLDGQTVTTFEQVSAIVRSYGEKTQDGAQKQLTVVYSRDGKEQTVALMPKMTERLNQQGKDEKRFEIGIHPLIIDALPATVDLKSTNPIAAIGRGAHLTWHWTSMTVLSFVRLFQAKVSPKNIGGFLSIGAMAKRSWQIGPAQFLTVMGIISINLFVLNLLPVPVLDGGHLVFYSIEAIKGAPLSMRKMEIAQQVGLVLLLVLMVFAFYNDVTRMLPH